MKLRKSARIAVTSFFVIALVAAIAQSVFGYVPPDRGGPKTTVGQGRSARIETTVNACGDCTTDAGTKGSYSDQKDLTRCVQCDGRVD